MSNELKSIDRRSPQEPTAAFCPANRFSKGQNHHMSDWSYWAAGDPLIEKHPRCGACGYIDRGRVLSSWEKSHAVDKEM